MQVSPGGTRCSRAHSPAGQLQWSLPSLPSLPRQVSSPSLTCGTRCSLAHSGPNSPAIFCSVLAVASRIDATCACAPHQPRVPARVGRTRRSHPRPQAARFFSCKCRDQLARTQHTSCAAALTWSSRLFRQCGPSFSWKNSAPSWLASSGMCSTMASRTRQCLSSASSSMAGSRLWASSSMPITCGRGRAPARQRRCALRSPPLAAGQGSHLPLRRPRLLLRPFGPPGRPGSE